MYDLHHRREEETQLLLSLKEAAHALSLSERTVWTMVQTGDLPHVRIGRRLLFSITALQAWIARQETNSSSDTAMIG